MIRLFGLVEAQLVQDKSRRLALVEVVEQQRPVVTVDTSPE
jgi:hypothetical protein